MRQLPVKLPKSFEEALGYPGRLTRSHEEGLGYAGQVKWAAFYWEPCGDEAVYDDGICSGDGNWWAFLQFVRHPSVAPWLANYDLGSSDREATHWLLCDLENREVHVGEKAKVCKFLIKERKRILPRSPAIPLNADEAYGELRQAILKAEAGFREMLVPSMAEVEDKMRRDQAAFERMVGELG